MLKFIKGCTIQIQITVNEDITDWEIKAKLYDNSGNSIVVATTGAGGSDDEIEKTLEGTSESTFVIKIPQSTTFAWENNGYLEIKVDTGETIAGEDEILQGYKSAVQFIDSDLNWDND